MNFSRSRSHLIYSQQPISNRCTEKIECIDHSCWRVSIAKHEPFFSFLFRVFILFDLTENVHHCMKHAIKQHRKFGNDLVKVIDEKNYKCEFTKTIKTLFSIENEIESAVELCVIDLISILNAFELRLSLAFTYFWPE